MIPATTRPTLPLKLISLDIVENGQASPLSPSPQRERLNHRLQIVPGRRSELLVWIENTSSEAIAWTVEVTGEFPLAWCELTQQQPVIEPHSKISQLIAFEPPASFFERNDALSVQPQLQLSYKASVSIFAQLSGRPRSRTEVLQVPTLSPTVVSSSDLAGTSAGQPAGTLVGYKNVDITLQPGSTYLDFLPEIYRSDFMERFMAIFEQAFDPVVQTTDNLWAYLDPLTAPKSMIPFLAQWVDWPLNPDWTLSRQRKLIKHAVELYRWRGTRQGLRLILHLHTGLALEELSGDGSVQESAAIEVKESFETGFVLGQVKLGENPRLGGGQPYFFRVVLRPATPAEAEGIDADLVRRVIEQEKPAFCSYRLDIEQPYRLYGE